MPMQRGPFILQPATALNFHELNYDFTNSVTDDISELDNAGSEIDPLLLTIEAMAGDTSDPLGDIDVDVLPLAIDIGVFLNIDSALNDVTSQVLDGDTALGAAIAFAPSEAWTDPPAPYVPDTTNLTLGTVTLPAGAYNPGSVTTVGPGTGSGSGTGSSTKPTVSLLNLTTYGNPNFTVGDNFQLTVTGPAGAVVSASATKDGQDLGTTVFGVIGGDGKFLLTDILQTDNAGAWTENWFVGGQFVTSINFIVLPLATRLT